MNEQSNNLAVVTGASSGIGRDIARQLAAKGLDVLVVARREERLLALKQELEEQHGVSIYPLPVDLAETGAANKICAEVERIGQPLKWLVNNAGLTENMRFAATPWEEHRDYLTVLLMLPVELTHKLIPALKQSTPAYVLNISSIAAFTPGALGMALYPSSKSFLQYFSQGMGVQLARHGIQVTASAPGQTDTEILEKQELAEVDKSKMMSSEEVARQAIEAAEKGKRIIVHGTTNKIMAYVFRVLPYSVTSYLLNKLMG